MGDDLETLQDAPVLQSIWESVGATRAKVLGGTYTWTPTSRIVNEFRIGYNSFRYSSLTADSTVNPTAYGINTGVTNPRDFGMPAILINGFLQEGGNVGWPRYQTPDQSLQFLDNISITRGKHAFKFGGEARRGWATSIKDRYGKGRIQFKKNGALRLVPLLWKTSWPEFLRRAVSLPAIRNATQVQSGTPLLRKMTGA